MERLEAVPFTRVQITDRFWTPRRKINRTVSIPHSLDMLEKAGNLRNFELAAQGKHEGYSGPVFMDSDLYKAIEAASYSLAQVRDRALEARLDRMIATIASAQMPDGYLNTHYQVNEPDRRWTNLRDNHEIYCAGHLFEAAVAHYLATGKRSLLDIACRYADHMVRLFGPGPGQRPGYCGHPEAELALVKLSAATGNKSYLALARYFVETRGSHFFATEHNTPPGEYDGTYWQDDVPIRQHTNIKGHAVRAAYLMSGVVDLLRDKPDAGLETMVNRVWRNTTQKRMYLTGGIGPSAHNEGFTTDYDLPNRTAYQETCASVAMAMWAHRMNLLYGDAAYADAMERTLYNGFLAGVQMNGTRYFYVNPLESGGTHHRSEWFGCACCPPNVTRTLAALGGYAYATGQDGIWVNLYIASTVSTSVGGTPVAIKVDTDYPWSGRITLTVTPRRASAIAMRLRLPGWCQGHTVAVNGKRPARTAMDRGYIVIRRTWKAGDQVTLDLAMPVTRVAAHPSVTEDVGLVALQRGPLVYCVEQADLGVPVRSVALPRVSELTATWRRGLLGGIVTIDGAGCVAPNQEWRHTLYAPAPAPKAAPIRAIPYCYWDNRAAGPMRVWLPEQAPVSVAAGPEAHATVSMSFRNYNADPGAVNDGHKPGKSSDQPAALLHFWNHKGTEEWAQYSWTRPVHLDGCRVYWFDDTGRGECRLPATWRLEYKLGERWVPIAPEGGYPVHMDDWCAVKFAPVTTSSIRVVVQLQEGWSGGIHAWQVSEPDTDD